jgi:CheY-specific phosphatase CheX
MRNQIRKFFQFIRRELARNGQLGGYVHDTAMSQMIPCTAGHYVTGTWTQAAGSVSGTIAMSKAAAAETATINIPVMIPSNSVGLKGSYFKSIEVDYEIATAAATSVTATMNKITRGTDTNGLTVAAVTVTQDLTAATTAATVAKHKLTVTITTPAWIANTEYYLLVITLVAAATTAFKLNSAVANFTERM